MNDIQDLAEKTAGKYFYENYMHVVGARIVGDQMYVKGFDSGFPHALGYVKVDLNSREIIKYYNANMCPVDIENGEYVRD